MQDIILGVTAGLLSSLFYAVSVIIYKSVAHDIRPLAVSAIKMWVSLAFIAILVFQPFRTTPFSVPLQDIIILGAAVTVGTVIGDTAYLFSQDRIGVSYAFPITSAYPITTYILAILFLGDQILPSRIFGVILAVVGIFVISRGQNHDADATEKRGSAAVGMALAILALIMYSFSTTLMQAGTSEVEAIDANFIRMLVGSIELAPAFAVARHLGMPLPSKRGIKVTVVAAFFGMALGSLLYLASIKYAGATIGAVVGSTSPLFGVPIAYAYLKERISRLEIVGIAATMTGVLLTVFVL